MSNFTFFLPKSLYLTHLKYAAFNELKNLTHCKSRNT